MPRTRQVRIEIGRKYEKEKNILEREKSKTGSSGTILG
jgi:hypothetical protein